MEIVLNRESKRKTASVIAFKDDQPLFGEDALTLVRLFNYNKRKNEFIDWDIIFLKKTKKNFFF